MTDPTIPEILTRTDTPTVCNAIEVVLGRRTTHGFTREPVVPLDPALPPIVGFAATATMRSDTPPSGSAAEATQRRIAYYDYIGTSAAQRPTIAVIEDQSRPVGLGALWGEVNVAVHRGLGVAGAITNGSMRDLDAVDPGFQILAGLVSPSHALAHVTEVDVPVNVFGLLVRPGDIIHADRHGAVVIDPAHLSDLPDAIGEVVESEQPILDAARAPGFSVDVLRRLLGN